MKKVPILLQILGCRSVTENTNFIMPFYPVLLNPKSKNDIASNKFDTSTSRGVIYNWMRETTRKNRVTWYTISKSKMISIFKDNTLLHIYSYETIETKDSPYCVMELRKVQENRK